MIMNNKKMNYENKNETDLKKKNGKINHWTKSNIDEATIKINKEIYAHDKQAAVNIKLDDLAIFINDKITRRGIQRGLVSIQEDLNNGILDVEKLTIQALDENDKNKKYGYLIEAKNIMKIKIWTDIRFLMINKAITPRRNY